jgi:hypothetical protein
VVLYSSQIVKRHLTLRPIVDPNFRGLWKKLLKNKLFETLDIDPWLEEKPHLSDEDHAAHALAAQMSIAYDDGQEIALAGPRFEAEVQNQARYAQAATRLASHARLDRVIVPSGIVGETAGLLKGFRSAGLEVVTVEAWGLEPRHMIWNLNLPTLHFDYAGWFEAMGEFTARHKRLSESFLAFQENPVLSDASPWASYRVYQPASADAALPGPLERFLAVDRPVVLLGTNVIGDSATLGREIAFESQLAWLDRTLTWFAERPEAGLVIRVHPGERFGPCSMPLAPWLRERVGAQENVCLVEPEVRVNTYAITERVLGGLLYVSNLGSDLVARRVPVVTVGKTPYYGLGITNEARDHEHYFELLGRMLAGELPVTEEARGNALRQIYVLTRFVSLRALPASGGSRFEALSSAGGDELERYYRLLSGDLTRSDQVEHDRQQLDRLEL